MALGYPRNDMVLGFNDHRLRLATAIRHVFRLSECLLVVIVVVAVVIESIISDMNNNNNK